MRHLVTGGAGFVGSALVRRLRRDGHEVTVFDRFSRGKSERIPGDVVALKGDIRDGHAVRQAVRNCDVIWHLAYIQGTQTFYAEPAEVIDVALRGILNVLEGAKGRELFLFSSSEVYQKPPHFPTDETVPLSVPDVTNPRYSYGGGKIACELAALAHSEQMERTVIVRPHNVIGPDMGEDHVIPQLARRVQELTDNILHIQGDGRATRCFNYIDDAIDGLMVLWEKAEDRNVYHLGDSREEIQIADLAHRIAEHYGRSIAIKPSELPQGSPTRRVPDTRKLRGLGYEPRVSFSDALTRTLEWYGR